MEISVKVNKTVARCRDCPLLELDGGTEGVHVCGAPGARNGGYIISDLDDIAPKCPLRPTPAETGDRCPA